MDVQGSDAVDRREIRLALVMNGGVSLAVWMGGVTAEIDRMRRAAYPDLTEPADAGDAGFQRWRTLLALLNTKLVVDVVAGASAGGLNGAVLAASIARARSLQSLKPLWVKIASAEKLAGDTAQPAKYGRRSILDGALFTTKIAEAFAKIPVNPADPPPAGAADAAKLRTALLAESVRPRSVSLATTATSLHGQGQTFHDSTGRAFTQVEYRVVCGFDRPLVGEDDFARGQADRQLTCAARASASFPAAFEPVFFASDDTGPAAGIDPPVSMQAPAGLEWSRWMVDGGVLDNEPFQPALERIGRRSLIHDVDRVVAYVTPEDGGNPAYSDSPSAAQMPGMIETVSAAMGLPRETNLLNELDTIAELEREGQAHVSTGLELLESALAGADVREAAELLRPMYWENRRRAIVHEVRAQALASGVAGPASAGDEHRDGPQPAAGSSEWGIAADRRVLRLAMTRARAASSNGPGTPPAVQDVLLVISAGLIQLDQIESDVMKAIMVAIPPERALTVSDTDLLRVVDERFESVGVTAKVAAAVNPALEGMVEAGLAGGLGAQEFRARCLDIEVVRRAAAPIGAHPHVPPFRFSRFGADIGTPYLDGGVPPPAKLMGLRLQHFGGFLADSWRRYDWMWGRLDGASHLVAMLIPLLRDAEAAASDLGDWVDAGEREQLQGLLTRLRNLPSDAPTPPELTRELTLRLVRPIHREILRVELSATPDASDEEIARKMAMFKDRVTRLEIARMCESENGIRVTGELVTAGLDALARDPRLPSGRLRTMLEAAGGAVRLDTGTAVGRSVDRLVLRLRRRWAARRSPSPPPSSS